jgi:hypothetical protein
MAQTQAPAPALKPAPPSIGKAAQGTQPTLRDTVAVLLSEGKIGMIVRMGQQAVDELAEILLDTGEHRNRRSDAAMALGEVLTAHETLDARKGLAALRWAARHERHMEVMEESVGAFKKISGLSPSQCNDYRYKDDRD